MGRSSSATSLPFHYSGLLRGDEVSTPPTALGMVPWAKVADFQFFSSTGHGSSHRHAHLRVAQPILTLDRFCSFDFSYFYPPKTRPCPLNVHHSCLFLLSLWHGTSEIVRTGAWRCVVLGGTLLTPGINSLGLVRPPDGGGNPRNLDAEKPRGVVHLAELRTCAQGW